MHYCFNQLAFLCFTECCVVLLIFFYSPNTFFLSLCIMQTKNSTANNKQQMYCCLFFKCVFVRSKKTHTDFFFFCFLNDRLDSRWIGIESCHGAGCQSTQSHSSFIDIHYYIAYVLCISKWDFTTNYFLWNCQFSREIFLFLTPPIHHQQDNICWPVFK